MLEKFLFIFLSCSNSLVKSYQHWTVFNIMVTIIIKLTSRFMLKQKKTCMFSALEIGDWVSSTAI